jgi:hypothetical protein
MDVARPIFRKNASAHVAVHRVDVIRQHHDSIDDERIAFAAARNTST